LLGCWVRVSSGTKNPSVRILIKAGQTNGGTQAQPLRPEVHAPLLVEQATRT